MWHSVLTLNPKLTETLVWLDVQAGEVLNIVPPTVLVIQVILVSGLGMLELTNCKAVPPQGRSKHRIPTCDKGMKGVGTATPLHEGSGSVAPEDFV